MLGHQGLVLLRGVLLGVGFEISNAQDRLIVGLSLFRLLVGLQNPQLPLQYQVFLPDTMLPKHDDNGLNP